jgi:DNA-binding beta-propeller fold protein YncE
MHLAQDNGEMVALYNILPGDILKYSCTYDSSKRDRVTYEGWTHKDEMCNIYLMFASNRALSSNEFTCTSYNSQATPSRTSPVTHFTSSQLVQLPMPLTKVHLSSPTGRHKTRTDKIGQIGQVGGVTFDFSRGVLYVFHRADRSWGYNTFTAANTITSTHPISQPTMVVFDEVTQTVKDRWGSHMFYMPHGVTFVDEPQPALWLTDVGLHQVFKFSVSGQQLLALGTARKPGKDREHFCKPTSVAVDRSSGMVFVADGYCNSRIVRFHPDGKFDQEWGLQGTTPDLFSANPPALPYKAFHIVHSVAWGTNGQLYVADRENGAIHSYSQKGLYQFTLDLSSSLAKHGTASQGDQCSIYSITTDPSGCAGDQIFFAARCGEAGGYLGAVDPITQSISQFSAFRGLAPHAIAFGASGSKKDGTATQQRSIYIGTIGAGSKMDMLRLPNIANLGSDERCRVRNHVATKYVAMGMKMSHPVSTTQAEASSKQAACHANPWVVPLTPGFAPGRS